MIHESHDIKWINASHKISKKCCNVCITQYDTIKKYFFGLKHFLK